MSFTDRPLARQYYIGLDLGQRRDHSAIVVLREHLLVRPVIDRVTFAPVTERDCGVVHIDRIALRTEYERVIGRVYEMLVSPQLREEKVVLAVDATGVGSDVFARMLQMTAAARARRGTWVDAVGVVFTGGGKESWEGRRVTVPKNELMEGLRLVVERKEIGFPQGKKMTEELVRELSQMRREMKESTVKWRTMGEHDDLVMALALAVWGRGYRPLPGKWEKLGWGRPRWEWEKMR